MNKENTVKELLPCPFCGKDIEYPDNEYTKTGSYFFGCSYCDIWMDSAEEWNTRTN